MGIVSKKLAVILLAVWFIWGFCPQMSLESQAEGHEHDSITFEVWNTTNQLPANAGNYYLNTDVTLSDTWTVPAGTTNLCLNGHGIIQSAASKRVIQVNSGSTLNIYDCDTTTEYKYSINTNHLAEIKNDGDKTFTGGYITGGSGEEGAGIYVNKGAFAIYGGNSNYSVA